ncbi:hypothetical protein LWI28_014003 [Acer negundo]|uniref:Phytosulfokine n=1 Tax=Acer negundo TaxID=4023 RepID=A0AAD5I6R9_ACENE|nr:hypothetical protein LWI28_014003 [Acer negundo]KAK4833659.1 hypothetical protein QYF36_008979 [Acer negundo]
MNKQSLNISFMFLLLVLLILSNSISARHLQPEKQDEKEMKANGIAHATISKEDLLNLMGSEDQCDEKDEDCLNRRMIAEAHLDYIYTQHQKP